MVRYNVLLSSVEKKNKTKKSIKKFVINRKIIMLTLPLFETLSLTAKLPR